MDRTDTFTKPPERVKRAGEETTDVRCNLKNKRHSVKCKDFEDELRK